MNVDYYLVSAARRSYRLKTGRTYCFGREEGVDILVQDALASRRHAEVRWHADGFWQLVDLKSRNGVLVNNIRIADTVRLGDGDQVQIGGQVFRLHLLPPGADPASLGNQAPQISNIETMGPGVNFNELAAASATFSGVVTGGVMELLQYFQLTGKSGRLDLVDDRALASVWIVNGNPVHASYGTATGLDALLALARKAPPRFSFHADALGTPVPTLRGSAQAIFMEIARSLDEELR
jgi:hypothetical protein